MASTFKRAKIEKYLLITTRGKAKHALVDFEYLKSLLKGVNDRMFDELEKLQKEFEEVHK